MTKRKKQYAPYTEPEYEYTEYALLLVPALRELNAAERRKIRESNDWPIKKEVQEIPKIKKEKEKPPKKPFAYVDKDPINLSKMTTEDQSELLNQIKKPTRGQINNFFEDKIGNFVCFEGMTLIVNSVFPRDQGKIAVEFLCPSKNLGLLMKNRKQNEQLKRLPVAIIETATGNVSIFGEIQLGIGEKFKVIF